jgi:hypothetical protein
MDYSLLPTFATFVVAFIGIGIPAILVSVIAAALLLATPEERPIQLTAPTVGWENRLLIEGMVMDSKAGALFESLRALATGSAPPVPANLKGKTILPTEVRLDPPPVDIERLVEIQEKGLGF